VITPALIAGWVAAIAGVVAWLATLYKIGPERNKIKAEVERAGVDAAKVLSDTAVSLLQPSIDQVGFLRTELAATRSENAQLREEIGQLREELSQLRRAVIPGTAPA
jgi:hypothetical protein